MKKIKPMQNRISPMPDTLGMIKMLGKPRRLRDSDNDGVVDILDCKPYNPKKQGLIHKAGKWVARKAGARKTEKWIGEREREAEELSRVRRDARHKQRLEYAREAPKVRTEARLKRLKKYETAGGFWGALPKPRPKPVVKRKKAKKKKKGKRKTTRKPSSRKPSAYGIPKLNESILGPDWRG